MLGIGIARNRLAGRNQNDGSSCASGAKNSLPIPPIAGP